MVQHKLMTPEGDFKLDSIRENVYLGEPKEREHLIEICTHKLKTPEDTAFLALVCFFDIQRKRHGSLKHLSQIL